MEIFFTDNLTKSLLDIIKPQLSIAKELKFGIAFAKYSGLSLIEDNLNECLENNGKADFILGLDFQITEPKVLKILYNLKNKGLKVKFFCFSCPLTSNASVYHPKIYIIKEIKDILISIGSSNLTAGGLKNNIELNSIIKANIKEDIVSDVYGIYNKLKSQKNLFEPNLDYIETYKEAYDIVQNRNIKTLKEKSIKNKIEELREKEKILPKPKSIKNDLFGWQKLVYERLPKGVLRTSDMYVFQNEFKNFYPNNKHITDKIRQILQQLRDLKLLKHINIDKWKKL